jgi:Transglycosylase SLT domain
MDSVHNAGGKRAEDSYWAVSADGLSRIALPAGNHFSKEKSGPGALGILQLMPQFFHEVRVPIPFSDEATRSQIVRAGTYLVQLRREFNSWAEALAAYNYGPGNEEKYLNHKIAGLPKETTDYVTQILNDVPIPGEPA